LKLETGNTKKGGGVGLRFCVGLLFGPFSSSLAVEIALVVEILNAFDALIGLDT
jgi:hypothetical protein